MTAFPVRGRWSREGRRARTTAHVWTERPGPADDVADEREVEVEFLTEVCLEVFLLDRLANECIKLFSEELGCFLVMSAAY